MSDYGSITLTLSTLAISISDFNAEDGFPRAPLDMTELQRSSYGALGVYGSSFEDPQKWEFEGIISEANSDLIQAMYWEHQRLKRLNQDAKILLVDTTQQLYERSPRTRAKAASPFDALTAVGTSWIKYYAQYWAYFDRKPEVRYWGVSSETQELLFAVKLGLIETEAKVAP